MDKEGNSAELTGGLSIDDMFDNVVKSQTLQVDVINGATLTSKVHLKALENALKQAQMD
ncbi:FMN-binding protein [Acidilutibacter cellobiosedens]|nr:FMN-binding protein [Acidilutibacter cellobiosedens]